MWNYMIEKFLTEYFLYETVLGSYADGRALFGLLSRIFLLSDEEQNFALNLIGSGDIAEIKTESDYTRYRRGKKYFELNGIETDVTADEDVAITVKGAAIAAAKSIGCAAGAALTRLKTEENLITGADGGNIAAMRLVGLMLSEGLFLTGSREDGLRYLRMAAAWNDVPSLLYSLHYDGVYTRRYAGKLGFLLRNAAHSEVLPLIESRYGSFDYGENKEAKLLERLFQLKVLSREEYSAPHARALFSRAISYKDKELLLYTAGKEYLPLVGDLPLKLGGAGAVSFDYAAFDGLPLSRADERRDVISRLNNSDLRRVYSYRPLCISCSSVFLLQAYADAIAAAAVGAHTEYINVSELDPSRLDHGKNNIFIRSCDEDRDNVYLMFFTGDLSGVVSEQARSFLNSDGRSRFSLNMPNISLNLSYILPVCFCDLKNEKYLRGLCDVVRIGDCTEDEKPRVLEYIAERKARLYGLPEIGFSEGLVEKLLSLSVDEMAKVIDAAVSRNRRKGERLVLTEQNCAAGEAEAGGRIGFGGYKQ